jgi:hypothetical protein
VNVAFAVVAFGLNVPVPPLTIDHVPVPTEGVLPPNPAVVPSAQIVWPPPTVAVVGAVVSVILNWAVESGVHGGFEIVHRSTTGPAPPVFVKVAFGAWISLKVPVPPLTTDHVPVPTPGVFPPNPAVVPSAQIVWLLPTVAVLGGWLIVMVTVALESAHGGFDIVHLRTMGPVPPVWVNVAFGVLAFGLNVPVPPLITDHVPVPTLGVLPPNPAVVPSEQIVWLLPTVAVVGGAVIVIVTVVLESGHGGFDIVHFNTTGPVPPVCVKVAFGVVAFGLNVPVPPLITHQLPVPTLGVLPPSPDVVPPEQIVCGPPAVAVVGGWLIVMVTVALESVQGGLDIVHFKTTGPVPVWCVKVALAVVAFGLNVPAPPLITVQVPVPTLGVLPPNPAVVPNAQIVCGPPTVAVLPGWLIVIVTWALEFGQGGLDIVHWTTIGPEPVEWVKVAFGVVAFGLNVPVPALTTDHIPVPTPGVLPPSPEVVPPEQIVWGPPTVEVVGGWLIVMVTVAPESAQGGLEIVHFNTMGPVPLVCVKVAFGVVAFGLKVPAQPLITDQVPVPVVGLFPPSPVVVPRAQMVCGPPTVAVVGAWLIVIVTVALESGVHGGLEIVHFNTTGPAPLVCVNVAFGVVAFGLNVPAPPLITDQVPVPVVGVLPPSPAVVPSIQIVCGPPTVAVVGGWLIVIATVVLESGHGGFEMVHLSTTGPVPLVWVKVALGVVAFGLNVPVPPLMTDHVPVPLVGVLPPSPAVVPNVQMVCGPPTVAVVGGGVTVNVVDSVGTATLQASVGSTV